MDMSGSVVEAGRKSQKSSKMAPLPLAKAANNTVKATGELLKDAARITVPEGIDIVIAVPNNFEPLRDGGLSGGRIALFMLLDTIPVSKDAT